MRRAMFVTACLFASCATPRTVRLRQHEEVVLSCETLAIAAADAAAMRATEALSFGDLRERFGGEVAALTIDYVELAVEHVVAVPLPTGQAVERVVVIEEEDVDVITLMTRIVDATEPRAFLMRVAARPFPIAIVLRPPLPETERTVANFPAL